MTYRNADGTSRPASVTSSPSVGFHMNFKVHTWYLHDEALSLPLSPHLLLIFLKIKATVSHKALP